jgi:hypothetical protein
VPSRYERKCESRLSSPSPQLSARSIYRLPPRTRAPAAFTSHAPNDEQTLPAARPLVISFRRSATKVDPYRNKLSVVSPTHHIS